jgi:hypothetical protein
MLLLLLSFALFALILALPTIPSLFEVYKPKDDGKLHISEQYVRDPRFFGSSFRAKLQPFVAEARGNGYGRAALQMRTEEDVRWAPDLVIPPDERLRGIGIGERVTVGHDAGIRDAYAIEHLDVESGVVARTLTSDATMHIGENVQVLRWVDSEGDVTVDAGADLGLSTSGGARVQLGNHVRFERVWGAPVSSHTDSISPFTYDAHGGNVVDAESVRDHQFASQGPRRRARRERRAYRGKPHRARQRNAGPRRQRRRPRVFRGRRASRADDAREQTRRLEDRVRDR